MNCLKSEPGLATLAHTNQGLSDAMAFNDARYSTVRYSTISGLLRTRGSSKSPGMILHRFEPHITTSDIRLPCGPRSF